MAERDKLNITKSGKDHLQLIEESKCGSYVFCETINISSEKVAEAFGLEDPIIYGLQRGHRVRISCNIIVEGNVKSHVEANAIHIRKQYGSTWKSVKHNGQIAGADAGVSYTRSIDSDSSIEISKEPRVAVSISSNDEEGNNSKELVVLQEKNSCKDKKSPDQISGDRIRKQYSRDWKQNNRNGTQRSFVCGRRSGNRCAESRAADVARDDAGVFDTLSNDSNSFKEISKESGVVSFSSDDKEQNNFKDSGVFEEKNSDNDEKSTEPKSDDHIRMPYVRDHRNNTCNGTQRANESRANQNRNRKAGAAAGADIGRSIESDRFSKLPKPKDVGDFNNDEEANRNVNNNIKDSDVFAKKSGKNEVKSRDPILANHNRKQYDGDFKNNTGNYNHDYKDNTGNYNHDGRGHQSWNYGGNTLRSTDSNGFSKLPETKKVRDSSYDGEGDRIVNNNSKDSAVFEKKNGKKDEKSRDPILADHIRKQYDGDYKKNTDSYNQDSRVHQSRNCGANTSRPTDSNGFSNLPETKKVRDSTYDGEGVRSVNNNTKDSAVFEKKNGKKDEKSRDPILADHIRKQYDGDYKNNTGNYNHDGRGHQSWNSGGNTSRPTDSDRFSKLPETKKVGDSTYDGEGVRSVNNNTKDSDVFEKKTGKNEEKSRDSILADHIRKQYDSDYKNNAGNYNHDYKDNTGTYNQDGRGHQSWNSGGNTSRPTDSDRFSKLPETKKVRDSSYDGEGVRSVNNNTKDSDVFEKKTGKNEEKSRDSILADHIRKQYDSDYKNNAGNYNHDYKDNTGNYNQDARGHQSWNCGANTASMLPETKKVRDSTYDGEGDRIVNKNSKDSAAFEKKNGKKDEKSRDPILADHIRKQYDSDYKNNAGNYNHDYNDNTGNYNHDGRGHQSWNYGGNTLRSTDSNGFSKLPETKKVRDSTYDEEGVRSVNNNSKDSAVFEKKNGKKDEKSRDTILADYNRKLYDGDYKNNNGNCGRGHQSRNCGVNNSRSDSFQEISNVPEVVQNDEKGNNSKDLVVFDDKNGNDVVKTIDPISADHIRKPQGRDYKNNTRKGNHRTSDKRPVGGGDVGNSRPIVTDSIKKVFLILNKIEKSSVAKSSSNAKEGNNAKQLVVFHEESGNKDEKIRDPISDDHIHKPNGSDYKNSSRKGNHRTYDNRGSQSRNSGAGGGGDANTSHLIDSGSCNKLLVIVDDFGESDVESLASSAEQGFNSNDFVVIQEKNGTKDEKTSNPTSDEHIHKSDGRDRKNSTCNGTQRASESRANQNKNGKAGAVAGAAIERSMDSNSFSKLPKEPKVARDSNNDEEGKRNMNNNTKDSAVFEKNNCKKDEKTRDAISADHNRKQYAGDHKNNSRTGNQRDGRERQTRNSTSSSGGGKNGRYGSSKNSQNSDTPLIDWDAVHKKSTEARVAKWSKCPKLIKDFYNEKPEVASLSAEDVERMRIKNNNTKVSLAFELKNGKNGEKIPNPVWTFEQCFGEYPDLLAEIMKQGFKTPSPIQCQAWPILLKGHDLIGISQTGTGKTLAFLLPAMIHTEYQPRPRGQRGGPNVLVLAPTRELAIQIETEVKKYSFRNMKAVCIYGGGDRRLQINDVERGAEIIICTPGRLNDLVQAKVIDLSTITFLILDEADRMLDMGFEPQIRKVMIDIRPDRQTVMTSATWPAGVRRLAESYMKNPFQVCVGSLDLAATHSVTQIIKIMSDDEEKYRSIKEFIAKMTPNDKAIVFCGRKGRADDLSSDLANAGFMTACIHGNRDQHDREQAITDIKTGMVKLLVATDVASRGLDIEDITYVINYDLPRSIEEYVHRVGRTGRAGRTGISISYLTRDDWFMAQELIEILEEASQEVPSELRHMSERYAAMKKKRANNVSGGNRHNYHGHGNNNRVR